MTDKIDSLRQSEVRDEVLRNSVFTEYNAESVPSQKNPTTAGEWPFIIYLNLTSYPEAHFYSVFY